MQKHVNLVDLVKSFPTNILLQNLASIQKRTSPIKFAHLAEKSKNGSISNLSTKGKTEKLVSAAPPSSGSSSGLRTSICQPRKMSRKGFEKGLGFVGGKAKFALATTFPEHTTAQAAAAAASGNWGARAIAL